MGAQLPSGLVLEPKKIRGYTSQGMLCSHQELDLGEDAQGLMELPDDAPLGQSLFDYLELTSDTLLDIDNKSLTHRPDLWGHYGFAREFAAIWKKPLADPFHERWQASLEEQFTDSPSPLRPQIQGECAALSYWALSVDGVQVGTSPRWMQERLQACGMRPINSIVDISNYVMLELGMPNHIFDRDALAGDKLLIRAAGKEQPFTTLDGVERTLAATDTVIADQDKVLVIGGVMGGLASGVSEQTHKLLIEVANWRAAPIRRTCHRLGLRTESSQRYEKSLDGHLCYRTLLRLLELVRQLHPGARVVGRAEYDGVDLSQTPKRTIATSPQQIQAQLGIPRAAEEMAETLRALGFGVTESGEEWSVTVPSFRATKDVEVAADIVEEVGRMVGYGQITPKPPLAPIKAIRLSASKVLQRKIQDYLVLRARCLEVMTYPLTGEAHLQKCHWPQLNEEWVLANALSQEHDRVRPSLIPSLIETAARNQKYHHRFQFFELGRSYLAGRERSQLALAFFDHRENRFVELLNQIENLWHWLRVPAVFSAEKNAQWIGYHPQQCQRIRVMGRDAGMACSLHPLIRRKFKIKGQLALAVIDITELEQKYWSPKVRYQPLPKYPSSTFDCTVVSEHNVPVGTILNSLKKVKIKELTQFQVVEVFRPEGKPEQKFVTLRAVFSHRQGTLSNEKVKDCEQRVVAALEKAGFPLRPS